MSLKIHLMMRPEVVREWQPHLEAAFADAGLETDVSTIHSPSQVDYVVYAPGGANNFAPFTNARAVLGLWAGVESVASNDSLTQPYARMVDEGLTQGMIEWVTGHVMRHHLDLDRYIDHPHARWEQVIPPLATSRHVTVLGLGQLGAACAAMLAQLGFQVTGWSRRGKTVPGVTCLSGQESLAEALSTAEILVALLPLTDETRDILNADRLALLPKGAVVLNPGRGALIDDTALLDALEAGHIAHATLDTFRVEPLPPFHPFWTHQNVTVTPHIASDTRPETASQKIAQNILRAEAGEPLLNLLDKSRGY